MLSKVNTLKSVAEGLKQGRTLKSDVALAKATGLTRQSISKALSGTHNFSVTTLLAIAEANGQELVLVPRQVARAILGTDAPPGQTVQSMTDDLRNL